MEIHFDRLCRGLDLLYEKYIKTERNRVSSITRRCVTLDVKIICRKENHEIYQQMLERAGFTVVSEANLVLREQDFALDAFLGEAKGQFELIPYSRIVSIESFGRTIVVHTPNQDYTIREKLYEAEDLLRERGFVRIGKSIIVAKAGISNIRPSLNGRFTLTMKNAQQLSVSKSYGKSFRTFIGF
ncbi:MAG TPA: LytTR family transcriptional regulator [Acholeplasmatales bacterium]|nr:LytTR family transcriptional regulator [Acholeplasmatales bacterium]